MPPVNVCDVHPHSDLTIRVGVSAKSILPELICLLINVRKGIDQTKDGISTLSRKWRLAIITDLQLVSINPYDALMTFNLSSDHAWSKFTLWDACVSLSRDIENSDVVFWHQRETC